MPASRDKSQKPTFVYQNLYELYKKGKDAAKKAQPDSFHVIRAKDANLENKKLRKVGHVPGLKVRPYEPVELLGKRIQRANRQYKLDSMATVKSLRDNLEELKGLQNRLRFMLKELEDLVVEDPKRKS